jgi:hypothetical protein
MTWKTRRYRNITHPNQVVDYVLLAEFDIDTGSTLRHQYPANIPDYKADWFAEHMLPEGAHNREIDYTYIFLNRNGDHIDEDIWVRPKGYQSSAQERTGTVTRENPVITMPLPTHGTNEKYFLYGLNLVKTRHDSSVRRGAIVKAMCIFSRFHFIETFKAPLELALQEYFDNRSVDVLKHLFDTLNCLDLSHLPRPDYLECLMMRRGVKYLPIHCSPIADHLPTNWSRSVVSKYRDQELKLSIPVHYTPDEVGDISVTNLVKLFGESVMRIYHAILTKQRVLFVGYNHAARDIAQMVLSSVAMLSPPMTGIIRRTFPYANLADLNFLEVKGYIAGVTNPMFQQHDKWWDLLCVLDMPNFIGQVFTAEEKAADDKSNGVRGAGGNMRNNKDNQLTDEVAHLTPDLKFIQTVLSGIQARLGEEWVRQQFLDYTTSIFMNTLDKGMFLNPSKLGDKAKRLIEANLPRMSHLDACCEFQQMPSNLWAWTLETDQSSDGTSITDGDLDTDGLVFKTYIRKIKYEAGLESKQETEVFFNFFEKHLRSEASVQALLVMLPESQGGVLPIAAGLLSSIPTVRMSTTQILLKIDQYPSTKSALSSLNSFMKSAFDRQVHRLRDGSLLKEVEEYKKKLLEISSYGLVDSLENKSFLEGSEDNLQEPNIVDTVMETIRSNSVDAGHFVESIENIVTSTLQQTLSFIGEELAATGNSESTELNARNSIPDTNDLVLLP